MKPLLGFLLPILLLGLACNRQGAATPGTAEASLPKAVPAEHQTTYDELITTLNSFTSKLPPDKSDPLLLGAELSYANGNIGEALLEPSTMSLVQVQLDALKSMGVKAVVVAIKFPLLEADFPRSSEYLDFFKQVSSEIHDRDMIFLVEVGPLFAGTIYSPLEVDWSGYDRESFIAAQQQELVTIANEIQPDILQIANEPGTIAMLSGVRFTPTEYRDFIQSSVEAIGHPHGLRLGAGAGTWEDPDYMDSLMSIDGLDCIDLHIYPIGRDARLLQRAYDTAIDVRANGKCAIISEAGLYKVGFSDLSVLGGEFESIYRQDAFSFWEPADEAFLTAVTRLSQASGVELVSFFWTRSLFAYLDYDEAGSFSAQRINRELNQAARENLQDGHLSPLGEFFKLLVAQQTP
jgi:hypothetical protein